ncbi:hypothetical protein D3C76_1826470 [compost metagenome]
MALSAQQTLMFMLTMDIDQLLAYFPQHGEIDQLPINAGRTLPLCVQFTSNDQMLFRLTMDTQLL